MLGVPHPGRILGLSKAPTHTVSCTRLVSYHELLSRPQGGSGQRPWNWSSAQNLDRQAPSGVEEMHALPSLWELLGMATLVPEPKTGPLRDKQTGQTM